MPGATVDPKTSLLLRIFSELLLAIEWTALYSTQKCHLQDIQAQSFENLNQIQVL